MQAFYEFVWSLFNNKMLLIAGAWTGLPITFILIVMFVRKQNRDERGWKITGKASVISFIYFIFVVNLLAKTIGYVVDHHEVHYLFVTNTIQWLYDTMIFVEVIAILILRKIE